MARERSAKPSNPAREVKHTATTEVRLERIAGMMRRLEWVTGESWAELAKEWNLGKSSLDHLAAEASKRVRAELMNDEHVGATVGAALDTALRGAIQKKDWKSVAQLAKVYADAAGVSAPQKIDAIVTGDEDGLARKLLGLVARAEAGEDSGESDSGRETTH